MPGGGGDPLPAVSPVENSPAQQHDGAANTEADGRPGRGGYHDVKMPRLRVAVGVSRCRLVAR